MNIFNMHDTTISFINNDEIADSRNFKHYGIFYRVLNMLIDNGYTCEKDDKISKCLRKDHYVGHKNNLKFKASKYPRGFKIEFYQDINITNPHGGYYDFDKFHKMPYLIQKQFQCITNKISKFLLQFAENKTDPVCYTAEDKIKHSYIEDWHHPQTDIDFNLSDLDGTTCEGYNNNHDRDKNVIYNGEIKYFRDHKGYLCRGKVYHNINNMWWVMIDNTNVRNIAAFELFNLLDSDERKRKANCNPPETYLEKRNVLSKCSIKELKNELRRRKTAS